MTQLLITTIIRKIKEKRMLKGKLTYTAVITMALVAVGAKYGLDEATVGEVVARVGNIIADVTFLAATGSALYGRFRAGK